MLLEINDFQGLMPFLTESENILFFPFLVKRHIIFLVELTPEEITDDLRTLLYFSSFFSIYFLLSHFLTLIVFLCFPVFALFEKMNLEGLLI